MIKKLLLIASGVFVLVASSACGANDQASRGGATPTPELQRHSVADRVKNYETFAELRTDSTLIVRATAVSSTIETLHDTPQTITTLKVAETLHGELPPANEPVRVRQLGSAKWSTNLTPLLIAGREYVLFLLPWWLKSPDERTGQWVITGEQGMYALDATDKGAVWRYAVEENPGLPATLSTEAVESGAFLR
ncbi:hypothetical protein [Micromonospora sp. NPDC004704]